MKDCDCDFLEKEKKLWVWNTKSQNFKTYWSQIEIGSFLPCGFLWPFTKSSKPSSMWVILIFSFFVSWCFCSQKKFQKMRKNDLLEPSIILKKFFPQNLGLTSISNNKNTKKNSQNWAHSFFKKFQKAKIFKEIYKPFVVLKVLFLSFRVQPFHKKKWKWQKIKKKKKTSPTRFFGFEKCF